MGVALALSHRMDAHLCSSNVQPLSCIASEYVYKLHVVASCLLVFCPLQQRIDRHSWTVWHATHAAAAGCSDWQDPSGQHARHTCCPHQPAPLRPWSPGCCPHMRWPAADDTRLRGQPRSHNCMHACSATCGGRCGCPGSWSETAPWAASPRRWPRSTACATAAMTSRPSSSPTTPCRTGSTCGNAWAAAPLCSPCRSALLHLRGVQSCCTGRLQPQHTSRLTAHLSIWLKYHIVDFRWYAVSPTWLAGTCHWFLADLLNFPDWRWSWMLPHSRFICDWLMALHINEVNVCRSEAADSTGVDASLSDWLRAVQPSIRRLREHLQQWHHQRGGLALELGLATAHNFRLYWVFFNWVCCGSLEIKDVAASSLEDLSTLSHSVPWIIGAAVLRIWSAHRHRHGQCAALQWSACTLWLARRTAWSGGRPPSMAWWSEPMSRSSTLAAGSTSTLWARTREAVPALSSAMTAPPAGGPRWADLLLPVWGGATCSARLAPRLTALNLLKAVRLDHGSNASAQLNCNGLAERWTQVRCLYWLPYYSGQKHISRPWGQRGRVYLVCAVRAWLPKFHAAATSKIVSKGVMPAERLNSIPSTIFTTSVAAPLWRCIACVLDTFALGHDRPCEISGCERGPAAAAAPVDSI